MCLQIARLSRAPPDFVLASKIGAPGMPELTFPAVDLNQDKLWRTKYSSCLWGSV